MTKLILIEGIMGASKTTTAQFVETLLGCKTELYLEGNLDHPADYDKVAVVGSLEPFKEIAEEFVERAGEDILVHYGKAKRPEFQPYDIYDGIGLEKHRELLVGRWAQFAKAAQEKESTTIFECAFLQNPMCMFLAKHNAGAEAVEAHIQQLAELVRPLDPLLIYIYQPDIRATIEQASQERPKEWMDAVIWYHTQQAYGAAHGLQGLDGFIEFLEMRQALEVEICKRLPMRTLVIERAEMSKVEQALQK